MQHKNWSCIKCGHIKYEIGEMRVAGSFWQKILMSKEQNLVQLAVPGVLTPNFSKV